MKAVEKTARDEMIQAAGETEGARRATGVSSAGAPATGKAAADWRDVEVVAQVERRRFTAEYKCRIVREADRCKKPGETGERAPVWTGSLLLVVLVQARQLAERGPSGPLRPALRPDPPEYPRGREAKAPRRTDRTLDAANYSAARCAAIARPSRPFTLFVRPSSHSKRSFHERHNYLIFQWS